MNNTIIHNSFDLALGNVSINNVHNATAQLLNEYGDQILVFEVELNVLAISWSITTIQDSSDQVKAFMDVFDDGEI